jgi:tetratricopeptide (TPR) repeat protein
MKLLSPSLLAFLAAALSGACVHTPPGTSVEVALARKAEVVRLPPPPPSAIVHTQSPAPGQTARPVEPELPSSNKVELVADAYTRGQFCMKTGKDEEAIAAFEETVKLDPGFTDAWQSLAMLYEKTGQEKKALEAFRKSKKVAGR